jgi:hypothetical protein
VDTQAEFQFVNRDTKILNGISFDTPDSELRTSHRSSTFDAVVRKYNLKDSTLSRLGRIIHDIELNKWEEPLTSEAKGLEAIIDGIRRHEGENIKALYKSFDLFDWLYAHLAEQ